MWMLAGICDGFKYGYEMSRVRSRSAVARSM
jgi:hypothetical protein